MATLQAEHSVDVASNEKLDDKLGHGSSTSC
jgi:hypothetical protein